MAPRVNNENRLVFPFKAGSGGFIELSWMTRLMGRWENVFVKASQREGVVSAKGKRGGENRTRSSVREPQRPKYCNDRPELSGRGREVVAGKAYTDQK